MTKESDRTAEENHVRMALKSCGHPEWSLKKRPSNRKGKEKRNSQLEQIGRVTIPYVAKTSEKVAKVFREHRIQATHRPVKTLASALFSKKKDQIHYMIWTRQEWCTTTSAQTVEPTM